MNLPIYDEAFKSDPYPFYDALRRSFGSIAAIRLPNGVEAWLVIGYSAAQKLLRDPRLSKQPPAIHGESRARPHAPAHRIFDHLLMLDPPRHTRLRRVLSEALPAQRFAALRPRILRIVSALLGQLMDRREADLIADFAFPLPFTVICSLLGIPAQDQRKLRDSVEALAVADLDAPERVPLIAEWFDDYFCELADRKRRTRANDAYGALVRACDKGECEQKELPALGFLLLAAGHETTANLIGNGIHWLLSTGSWPNACADLARAERTVEELLRYDNVMETATARYATEVIDVGRVTIQKGDLVFVGLAAANRDPAHFGEPHRLNVARDDASAHLSFGRGIHRCIGASLARLEAALAFVELARRFPHLSLAGAGRETRWKPGLITRGLQALSVSLGERERGS